MRSIHLVLLLLIPRLLYSAPEIAVAKGNAPMETREKMMVWSRHLGVTCVYCHNLENFKDDAKQTFKTSLKHSHMNKILQDEIFSERDKGGILKVKVDCFMCHRGKEVPDYQEPPDQLTK